MSLAARNLSLRAHFGDDRHPTLAPAVLYFALFAGDPAVLGVEPDGTGGYARVAKPNDATLWGPLDASAVAVSNAGTAGEVLWPALTALWSVVELNHWAIYDNATGGTLWHSGPLNGDGITLTGVGDVPRIPAGALLMTQS